MRDDVLALAEEYCSLVEALQSTEKLRVVLSESLPRSFLSSARLRRLCERVRDGGGALIKIGSSDDADEGMRRGGGGLFLMEGGDRQSEFRDGSLFLSIDEEGGRESGGGELGGAGGELGGGELGGAGGELGGGEGGSTALQGTFGTACLIAACALLVLLVFAFLTTRRTPPYRPQRQPAFSTTRLGLPPWEYPSWPKYG